MRSQMEQMSPSTGRLTGSVDERAEDGGIVCAAWSTLGSAIVMSPLRCACLPSDATSASASKRTLRIICASVARYAAHASGTMPAGAAYGRASGGTVAFKVSSISQRQSQSDKTPCADATLRLGERHACNVRSSVRAQSAAPSGVVSPMLRTSALR